MHFRAGQGKDDSPPRFAPPFVVCQSQYNSRKNKINSAGTKVGFEGTKLRDGTYHKPGSERDGPFTARRQYGIGLYGCLFLLRLIVADLRDTDHPGRRLPQADAEQEGFLGVETRGPGAADHLRRVGHRLLIQKGGQITVDGGIAEDSLQRGGGRPKAAIPAAAGVRFPAGETPQTDGASYCSR